MSLRRLGLLILLASGSVSPAVADEPVLLKYKFAKGDQIVYRKDHEAKEMSTVFDMKIDALRTQEAIVSQVVDAIDGNGNATLKTKMARRKVKMDGQQGKYEFDSKSSERDTTSEIGSKNTALFERLTGSEYEVKVNPRGEVVEVKGFAELGADLLKENPQGGQYTGAVRDNASARLGEQQGLIVFSDKPVKPGDTWEVPIDGEITGVGKIKGKTVYTYEGNDKVGDRKTVRIGMVTDLSFELKIDSNEAKVSGTISSTSSSGTVQFDPAAGRIVSSKQTTSMGGQLTIEAGGMVFTINTTADETDTATLLDKLPE